MDASDITNIVSKGFFLALLLSLPSILAASLVGILISLLQALTQVQEQTLSFAVKLIAVGVVLALTGRWMSGEIYNYAVTMFDAIPRLAR